MNLDEFAVQIKKTGFLLEFQVSDLLREHGWTVIHNKYYVDDQSGAVREIDLVAYKATTVRHFLVYTTLIVSCKKSESNVWALLSKDKNPNDPNADWRPLCLWTNDQALDHMIGQPQWPDRYLDGAKVLTEPIHDTFAFQELNRAKGTVQNDKPIFGSVTSLVKAQAYELAALPERKKEAVIYQFNLLSVVDTQMVRLHFQRREITPSTLDDDTYIARYIVGGHQTSARVHFIGQDVLPQVVSAYDDLHRHNTTHFGHLCTEFYASVFEDEDKASALATKLPDRIGSLVGAIESRQLGKSTTCGPVYFRRDETTGRLLLKLALNGDIADALNQSEYLRDRTSRALSEIFHYDGDWAFAEYEAGDMPF